MAEHIHWKKTTNPEYLGTFAFEKDEEKIVKVADVKSEKVNNPGGTTEDALVMYFEGNIKPNKWILNVTNMKRIQKATGTPYIDEWVGHKLQLYVDPNVPAFGEIVEGVRARDFEPK